MPDGTVMNQGYSILRSLGMAHGFYSEDPMEMWRIDSTIDAIYDIIPKLEPIHFAPSDDAKKAALEKAIKEHLPAFFKIMEARLQGKTSIIDGKTTIADFAFGAFLSQSFYNKNNPHMKTFQKVVKAFPNVQAFQK